MIVEMNRNENLSSHYLKQNQTVNNVTDIKAYIAIDCSGSMWSKIESAKKGLIELYKQLKSELGESNITIYAFNERVRKIKYSEIKSLVAEGSTNLHGTIQTIYDDIKANDTAKKAPSLVNVFTDGQDTSTSYWEETYVPFCTLENVNKLLTTPDVTFTFVCTQFDVASIKSIYKIHDSNINVYDNTASGVEKSFSLTTNAVSNYTARYAKGEDVSVGFYKSLK